MNFQRLTDTLVRHEGSHILEGRHRLYKCTAGKETIGYGRNLTDRGISEGEAKTLLHNDIQDSINEVRDKLYWFDSLDDVRQEVIVNMAFNLGVPGLMKFRNTIGYIEEGEYGMAAQEMLNSQWAAQVGYRAQELSRMMASGVAE